MKIEGDLDTMRIIAPTMRPFAPRDMVTCPACGLSADYRWRRILRIIKGKAIQDVARVTYCPGDKPPSEDHKGFAAMLLMGDGERVNRCSGIPLPHLHLKCSRCNAEWFSDLKERP